MPAQTPSASALPTASQRDKRRNRFFEAISTAPRTEQAEQSHQFKQQHSASQSKPHKAHDAKSKQKSSSTSSSAAPHEIAFQFSPEASKLFEKVAKAGINANEAIEELMSVVRADLAAKPGYIPGGGVVNQEEMLRAVRAVARMAQAPDMRDFVSTRPDGLLELQMSVDSLVRSPRETLSPAHQKAQDELIGVEELRAKTDMPLSNNPNISKTYINNILRVNGEAPFPFDQLTEYRDPDSALGRYVNCDFPAQLYLLQLRARKPDLAQLLLDMIHVYQSRAVAVGGHIKLAS